MKIQTLLEEMGETQGKFKNYLVNMAKKNNGLYSNDQEKLYVSFKTGGYNPYKMTDPMQSKTVQWVFYFDDDGITKIEKVDQRPVKKGEDETEPKPILMFKRA